MCSLFVVRCVSELFRSYFCSSRNRRFDPNKWNGVEQFKENEISMCMWFCCLFSYFAHLLLGIHWLRDIFFLFFILLFIVWFTIGFFSFCCDIWLFCVLVSSHCFLLSSLVLWWRKLTTNDTRMRCEVPIHTENFGPENVNNNINAENVWQCCNLTLCFFLFSFEWNAKLLLK